MIKSRAKIGSTLPPGARKAPSGRSNLLLAFRRETMLIVIVTVANRAPKLTIVEVNCGKQEMIAAVQEQEKPNVVIIYADDLGYGDLECYGAEGVKTPNVNKLASEGIRFTNMHAVAATSTPSRYSLLTGEYAWRKPGTDVGKLMGEIQENIPKRSNQSSN